MINKQTSLQLRNLVVQHTLTRNFNRLLVSSRIPERSALSVLKSKVLSVIL